MHVRMPRARTHTYTFIYLYPLKFARKIKTILKPGLHVSYQHGGGREKPENQTSDALLNTINQF